MSLLRLSTVLLAAVAMSMSIAVPAHHNDYACLARDRSQTVEGVVEAFRFVDPHVVIVIRTADSRVVTAEWMTTWELSNRWGITRDILIIGDRVAVTGSPYDCEDNKLSLLTEVRRLEDGWSWARSP